jgi:hypothetical protein
MYYTGIDPMTGRKVYVTTDYREKQLQRALLQYSKPENANLVREALRMCGREDLIGNSPDCLVRPDYMQGRNNMVKPRREANGKRSVSHSRPTNQTKGGKKAPSTEQKAKKSSKMDRLFGQDASRIRKEAERMASTSGKSSKKRADSGGAIGKKTNKR